MWWKVWAINFIVQSRFMHMKLCNWNNFYHNVMEWFFCVFGQMPWLWGGRWGVVILCIFNKFFLNPWLVDIWIFDWCHSQKLVEWQLQSVYNLNVSFWISHLHLFIYLFSLYLNIKTFFCEILQELVDDWMYVNFSF